MSLYLSSKSVSAYMKKYVFGKTHFFVIENREISIIILA